MGVEYGDGGKIPGIALTTRRTPKPGGPNSWATPKRQMLSYLTDLWQRLGPFDGIMGYSQGAAVAGGRGICWGILLEMGIDFRKHMVTAWYPGFKQRLTCVACLSLSWGG